VQLWTHWASGWQTPVPNNRYVYKACTVTLATITDPTPGSTLSGSAVTFKWSGGLGADQYWLDVGTSLGHGNICAGATTITQSTCHNIPTDGSTIYVQLYTHVNGAWQGPNRATYTAASLNLAAKITSPENNTLPGASVTFQWTSVAGATGYWLDVGNFLGRGDICAVFIAAPTTQYTCNNIPTDGRPIYVQLYTQVGGGWQFPNRYPFQAFNAVARMSTPSPGLQLSNPTTFCWTTPTLPSDIWLDVGTILGQGNIFGGRVTGSCQTVNNIPSGGVIIYVQLWTRTPPGTGAWQGPIQYPYSGPH
jgi:hypothetical protein